MSLEKPVVAENQSSDKQELTKEGDKNVNNFKFQFEREYVPSEQKNTGLIIGKSRVNLININKKCKEKFNKSTFIMIKNNAKKTTFLVKSNSEEVVDFVFAELAKSEQKRERFNNKYYFHNPQRLNVNEINEQLDSIPSTDRRIWLSNEKTEGYVYLRRAEDTKKLEKVDCIKLNSNGKFDYNVNIKYRRIDKDETDIDPSAIRDIVEERMRIIIDKDNKYNIYINGEKKYGKIFLENKDDVSNVIYGLNKFEDRDVQFIAYEYNKNQKRNTRIQQNTLQHSIFIRNICNYITTRDVEEVITRYVKNDFKVLMRMREDDNELNKGTCKVLIQDEGDCISLLNNLSGRGFHGTFWQVSMCN